MANTSKAITELDDLRTITILKAIREAKERGMNEVGQAYEAARAIRKADAARGLVEG